MAIAAEIRLFVRQRANFACEYCGITETDAGGELTIDHFRPLTKGGTDDPDNLIYCCQRCNQHKSDYWPGLSGALALWNPRREPATNHFLPLDDGTLLPLTLTAEFTLQRLYLNREALIHHRSEAIRQAADSLQLARYETVFGVVPRLLDYLLAVLEENRRLKRTLIALIGKIYVNQAEEPDEGPDEEPDEGPDEEPDEGNEDA